uniref:2-oxoglutarate and iron-dependent oxygenase domain-containing protein 2 isoform X1 n=1 Tax=Myxine glutinosa TaxID=7769 RepID=UPI00358E3A6C
MAGGGARGKFFACSCFFTTNIFVPTYGVHVSFRNEHTFRAEHGQLLKSRGCLTEESFQQVISQIKAEIDRRRSLGSTFLQRQKAISESYKPLHPEVYSLQRNFLATEFLQLVDFCNSREASLQGLLQRVICLAPKRTYRFPIFTKEFCHLFLDELHNFERSGLPKGRPNSMNQHGISIAELGCDASLISPLYTFLRPITRLLYPDLGGDALDSHKAFVVHYGPAADQDLAYHFDNAEITLNVCLGEEFEGGELYFGSMQQEMENETEFQAVAHQLTFGILHCGQHRHGALPLSAGERWNLIVWLRASCVRNLYCPMCASKPELVETLGFGEGFSLVQNDT